MKASGVRHKMWKNGMRHSGSKNQSLTPVVFEYRKPHREGKPAYYSMKSFHTVGCLPSGLDAPYRLKDFHKYYVNAYLPEPLEDWLDEVRPYPIETANESLQALRSALQNRALPAPTRWRPKPMLTHLDKITQPMEDILNIFVSEDIHRGESRFYPFVAKPDKKRNERIGVPHVVTRHLMNNHFNELSEVTELLGETWQYMGSTPHRRWLLRRDAKNELESSGAPGLPGEAVSHDDNNVESIASGFLGTARLLLDHNGNQFPGWTRPPGAFAVKASIGDEQHTQTMGFVTEKSAQALAPTPLDQTIHALTTPSPNVTYEDELLLIQLHNLVARAARETKEYDLGISVSQISLSSLTHDDVRASKVHGDLATLWFEKGDYETAIIHAQRAVILGEYGVHRENTPQPQTLPESSTRTTPQVAVLDSDANDAESVISRGYVVWSLALAQQDHVDDALFIAARGYENRPTNGETLSNLRKLQRFACGRVVSPISKRSVRIYNEEMIRRAVDRTRFKAVHHSIVHRSTGYQWMFWNHPMGMKYRYDPRGF